MLDVEPATLKEFEVMVRKDFAGPGPYPTNVLQTISKLRRPPTLSSLSFLTSQLLFLRSVPNALNRSGVFGVTTNTGMVDDSAAIVDNSLGLVINKSKVAHISHMEQAILKQNMFPSTQSSNIFLQMRTPAPLS